EGKCHDGSKASKVVYLGQSGRLATTGFSRYSDRQLAIWQENDLSNPLRIEDIDSSSGVIFPFYDADTRILYLAGKGDGNIRYYEIVEMDPYWFYLNQYLSGWKMPTNKPVVYKPSEKKLITSDLNNERKFLFISQETHPDYRSLDCRTPGKPSIAELEERTCATLRNGNHCDSMEVTSISNSSPKTIVASSSFDASSEKKCERLDASVNGSENMDSLTTTRSAKCGMESTPNSPSRPERLEVTSTPKPAKRNGASPPSVTPRRRSVTPVSSDNSPCPKLAKDMDGRPQQRHGVDSGTSTATPTTSEDEDEGRKFACSLEDVRRGGVTSGGGTLRQAPRRSQSVSWRRRSAPPRGPIVCEIIAALQRHSSFS
ncbi:unnamed protein product, partial [Notodromas monacha]